ncbi:MAG: GTPase Era [bacterium]
MTATDYGPRSPDAGHRSGFVAIVGRPNAGKSALLNRLTGQTLAIVTPVPQTTRARLQGIVTLPTAQIVLVDTPAFHEPRQRLGARMVEDVRGAAEDADIILWVVDASVPPTRDDELVAAALRAARSPIVLALNKIDRLRRGEAAGPPGMAGMPPIAAVVPVSAATGAGSAQLVETLAGLLPEGPRYFPQDMMTDQQEQQLVREFIREQAMLLTREEVPHGIAVEIEEFTTREGQDLIYIRAVVLVERDAHRKILIGAGGRKLREIGRRARARIESLLGSRVYLDLWVKVAKDWRNKDALIRRIHPS